MVDTSFSGIITTLQNNGQAISGINETLNKIFPIATSSIASTASGGALGTLPSVTAGFLEVTISGTPYKVPLYAV
jgi:hypothetical protein